MPHVCWFLTSLRTVLTLPPQLNVEAMPWDALTNPYGNGFRTVETALTSVHAAQRCIAPETGRIWKFVNPQVGERAMVLGGCDPSVATGAVYGRAMQRPCMSGWGGPASPLGFMGGYGSA